MNIQETRSHGDEERSKSMPAKPIPEGYHSVTPYLIVRGAAGAIEFYRKAFGAVELFRFPSPDGKIGHAEIKIGDSPIMLADEYPDMGYKGPQSIGGSPVSLMIYVEDVDAIFNQAVTAGATVKEALQDKFYGDRLGTVVDPFGHIWHLSTHKEDVSMEEMERRAKAAHGG
jgi:PhnB protein